MDFIHTKILTIPQKKVINRLWNNEYPTTLQHHSIDDFDNYLNKLMDHQHIVVIDANGLIKGWFFSFTRKGEKWFSLLVNHSVQGKGVGTQLLNRAKETCTELNGWVIDQEGAIKKDGSLYKNPMDFYIKNNFVVLHDIRLETEKISAVKIRWRK